MPVLVFFEKEGYAVQITLINPTFLIRRPIIELTKQLSNDSITILTPRKPFKPLELKWHSTENLKANIITYPAVQLPLIPFEFPIPSPFFIIQLLKACKNADIIYCWTYFYLVSLFAVMLSEKVVLVCDTFPGYSFKISVLTNTLFRLYKPIAKLMFKRAKRIQVYTKTMIPYAIKYGVPKNKIAVTPTGVNLKLFKPKTNYKSSGIILFAGLTTYRKGFDIFCQLADYFKNKGWVFVASGLPVKVANVLFLGWRKDINKLLRQADVLVLPSRGEGLSGIIMEAMASGVPIVCANITGCKDLVNKDNGFLCDNFSDYAKAISKLMVSQRLRQKLGQVGRQKIIPYSWEKITKRFIYLK